MRMRIPKSRDIKTHTPHYFNWCVAERTGSAILVLSLEISKEILGSHHYE